MLSLPSWRRGRSVAGGGAGLNRGGQERTAQERNLSALLIVAATNNTAWNLVTPFMPLFVLELVGGDPVAAAAWSGIALGISPLMTALSGPFWGSFAERYGARPAMMRTLLTSPVLVLLLALCGAVWQVIALRFLIGIAGGFYVLVHALVGQIAPRDKVGQAIGSLQAISMVSLAVIPPIAGYFTDIWGIRVNFLFGAAIMLVSFWVMWRGYETGSSAPAAPASGPSAPKPEKKPQPSYWSLLRSPEMAVIATVIAVGQYVERVFWPLAPLLIVEMEPGSDQLGTMTGVVLGIGSGATALSAYFCGRLARKVPSRVLLLASMACGCLTLPIIVMADSFWQFVAARVLMGLLTGGIVTLAYAHVSTILPSDRLSTSFGMFASVAMVASAVGPVSLSTLATTAGLRSPLLAGAVGFGVCFVLMLVIGRRGARTEIPEQPARPTGGSA